MSPELRADPIALRRLENDELSEDESLVVAVVDVAAVDVAVVELAVVLVDESPPERRLVKSVYADCAPLRSPELIALKRLTTSFATSLIVLLEESEPEGGGGGGPWGCCWLCSVVRAVWAAEMSLLLRAVDTLVRNCPSGLFESALVGESCSTWTRYCLASVVSPD